MISTSDYYPFGMQMEDRKWSSDRYTYGFQGQEHDDELKGEGNSVFFKYRVHDPRLGRFLSVDPLAPEYAWNSVYAFSENRVIDGIELEGLEVVPYGPWGLPRSWFNFTSDGKAVLTFGLGKLPLAPRQSYDVMPGATSGFHKGGIFLMNSLASAYNGIAQVYNEGLDGKTGTEMMLETVNAIDDMSISDFTKVKTWEGMVGGFVMSRSFRTFKPTLNKVLTVSTNTGKTFLTNSIRFSQSSVNGLDEIVQSMRKNGWKGDPIDIVKMDDGMYTTVDNTRLLAAKKVGIDIKANVHRFDDAIPPDQAKRFVNKKTGELPKTWGEAVNNRIQNQKKTFRENFENGSFVNPNTGTNTGTSSSTSTGSGNAKVSNGTGG